MNWLNIILIILAVCLIFVVVARIANNLVKTLLITICVIFVSGMLWATFSGEQQNDVTNFLNEAKDYIVDVAKDIFRSGEENSGKLKEIKGE